MTDKIDISYSLHDLSLKHTEEDGSILLYSVPLEEAVMFQEEPNV